MRGPVAAGAVLVFALCGFGHFFFSAATAAVTNKKVSVSEVSFDSHVEDIQWCGENHKTVLLKTRSGRLYRSKDGGKTWMEISDLLQADDAAAAAAAAAAGGEAGAV
ncbi:BNR/Asp-box repeat-containing protein, related [Eimeria mitis]|uniref:BNR/Asp-box repeat-containing protein, related n=1 Tax=Eimeria mitis TaxID=44415 RepID=U6KBZ7_9EIME|nr:BNR/Asp-box repeat-containing protein, related [Eimeria mitis]CDJ35454.1 BNR/Asp-box repeat-containing protein, related [Eimeria mitis]